MNCSKSRSRIRKPLRARPIRRDMGTSAHHSLDAKEVLIVFPAMAGALIIPRRGGASNPAARYATYGFASCCLLATTGQRSSWETLHTGPRTKMPVQVVRHRRKTRRRQGGLSKNRACGWGLYTRRRARRREGGSEAEALINILPEPSGGSLGAPAMHAPNNHGLWIKCHSNILRTCVHIRIKSIQIA